MKKLSLKLRNLIFKLTLFFFISTIAVVLFYRFVPVFMTPLMVIRSVESLFSEKLVGVEHSWVSLEDINPSMQKAVLKAEDYKFFDHHGFDWDAIDKAMKYNQTHKRKKGASTISQQTAKNVFLWPKRDWVRKGLEAYYTVLIELFWPKERIMEVYLNVVELGPGVYGVEAAANKYFKKNAKNLTPAQASLIAAVLPNPRRFRIDRPSGYVTGRQYKILNRVSPVIPRDDESSLSEFFDLKFSSETDNDDDDE